MKPAQQEYPFDDAGGDDAVWITGKALAAIGKIIQARTPLPDPEQFDTKETESGLAFRKKPDADAECPIKLTFDAAANTVEIGPLMVMSTSGAGITMEEETVTVADGEAIWLEIDVQVAELRDTYGFGILDIVRLDIDDATYITQAFNSPPSPLIPAAAAAATGKTFLPIAHRDGSDLIRLICYHQQLAFCPPASIGFHDFA